MDSYSLPRISINLPQTESDDESLASLFPSLSFKERMTGFLVCILLGLLISLSSFGSFSDLIAGYPARFAILYSFGNLTSLCATMFLVGPKQQYQNMTSHHRRISAAIYISCVILTPIIAFTLPEFAWLIILLVVTQWAALVWYSLSYIPFGRRMAAGLARRLLA
jgi:hypothetical protein